MITESQNGINIKFDQIKVNLFKSLRYWYVLVIALVIGGSIGYYKARYNIKKYSVNGRVIVKDEFSSWGQEYFLPGMELVSSRNRLVNEIGIIRSFPLMKKVVDKMPHLLVSYYDVGKVNSLELYHNGPFSIEYDTLLGSMLYGQAYYLTILSEKEYLLSTDNFEDDKGKSYRFGNLIQVAGNTIRIKYKYTPDNNENKKYRFQFMSPDILAKSYQDRISIYPEDEESSILLLSLSGTNFHKEKEVLNTIMETFVENGLDESSKIAQNTIEFIKERMNVVKDSLKIAEEKLEALKIRASVNQDLGESSNIVFILMELEKERINHELTVNFLNQTIKYIQENDDADKLAIPHFLNSSSALFYMIQELIGNYNKKNKMLFNVKSDNAVYLQLLKEIKQSRSMLVVNLEALRDDTENKYKIADNQIKMYNKKLYSLPTIQKELLNAQRAYEVQNKLYTQLLEKRQEAEIAKAASIPKASIIDYATDLRVSTISVGKSSVFKKNLLIYFILGIGIVALLVLTNNKIIDKNDLRKVSSLPLVGFVGHNSFDSKLVMYNQPKSILAESFRGIRTNIQFLSHNQGSKFIILTSSVSEEGKTFCSVNLASSYALLGKKTVLIGGDLRKPRLHNNFGMKNTIGLSNYLIGKNSLDEIIINSGHINLDLILSGPIPPNPSELIASDVFDNLLNELKDDYKYDYIIIDTAPIGLVSDAKIILKYADVILLIVRQYETVSGNLAKIDHEIKEYKHNAGIVVNDIKGSGFPLGTYKSYYGFGMEDASGYSYGYSDEESEEEGN